ncbi:integrase arm-type DNA-binding domain-containing protein [Lonsdalea populi]|uniref:integrase arm-type DNA-binding domain-containing protein n=1 Tax=Lonsdalea populi TaxID=1172565 RepID=UPI003F68A598
MRDTVVPGFLCKITPAGRKVFMLQYRTNASERRKPALGQYGELTVDQARTMAQEWLAEVRRGGDPSAAKNTTRKAPTMKEFCRTFMEDYSKQRNKPSTQRGYQGLIDRCIIPIMGRMKVQNVKRPDVAALMKKLAYKPTEANKSFGVLRKMFNLAEVWGLALTARIRAATSRRTRPARKPGSSWMTSLCGSSSIWSTWRRKEWRTTLFRGRSACNSSSPLAAPKSARWNGTGLIWKSAVSSGLTARRVASPSR